MANDGYKGAHTPSGNYVRNKMHAEVDSRKADNNRKSDKTRGQGLPYFGNAYDKQQCQKQAFSYS